MQVLQDEKTCPEAAGAGVFLIGASSNRFVETAHEPGKAAQPLPAGFQPFRIAEQIRFLGLTSNRINLAIDSCRKQSDPTGCDVLW